MAQGRTTPFTVEPTNDEDQPKFELIGTPEIAAINDLFEQSKSYKAADFCKEAKVDSVDALPMARFKGAFAHIQKKISAELKEAA